MTLGQEHGLWKMTEVQGWKNLQNKTVALSVNPFISFHLQRESVIEDMALGGKFQKLLQIG